MTTPKNQPFGICERICCDEPAIGYNDDGEALCGDCMFDWAAEEFAGPGPEFGDDD